ncbi:polyisoprenoid-binding protein YceI [Pelomonas saccharophila]|uniref:Polyisoprenoid-binding protein YceI n=1 Tax=Roseateles saccharophilus TaxID=304 RepID=A0ABU1YHE2_ROSSA|nr:YceI family protein [Roseateles saccharophilus]MDR7268279.1 polyisoprenoid-binding protein YceI [Roseateles saccharophilus]
MNRLALLPALLAASMAQAAPATYVIDPAHTYPSFEADHMGMSYWRGKLTKNAGTIVYDKATGSGSVDVQMDLASIDFGLDAMNGWAKGEQFFNVAKNPSASFKGRFDSAPGKLVGELTLNGRTKPVTLTINQVKCMPHPLFKRDWCGADASGSFNREDFGLIAGKDYGFKMDVNLRIQVEAVVKE